MLSAKGTTNGGGGFAGLFTARPATTPFRKQVGWHIQQDEPHAAVLEITPGMARELMGRNEGEEYRNRALSLGKLTRYVTDMKRGWRLTGEAIILSKSGRLLNGQHRLKACIDAGVPFQTFVVFGIDDDAFAFMDIGKTRTAADIFSIHGIGDCNRMASAAYWVWKYHNSDMGWPQSGEGPTPDELWDFYSVKHPGLAQSIRFGIHFNGLAAPSLMIALHYLCAQKSRGLADDFFAAVSSGVGLRANSPELRLRNRLIEARIGGAKLSNIFEAAFTVLAWNAMRRGQKAPLLKWRTEQAPDLPFPSIA